jgi:hypothetical protein
MVIEYEGYRLEVEPWQELFFKGFVCWIKLGWMTITKTMGHTHEDAFIAAKRLIDHWKGETA